jgi:hypothetical protein
MPSELTVIVKNSERSLRTKHLCYESYSVNENDPFISKCVKEAVSDFGDTLDSIEIKINFRIQ